MRAAALLAVALTIAACDGLAGQGVRELRGRTFLSTAVSESDQPKILVAGTRIRLSFPTDRPRISASAGCNTLGADARIDGGRLVITHLAMTVNGCDQARTAQDAWLATFFGDGPRVSLSGSDLVLTRGRTEIRLLDRVVADPDRPLAGTRWNLETLVSGEVASSVPAGTTAYLVFAADGTVGGNDGCNLVSAAATVTTATIRFSAIVTTMQPCRPVQAGVEDAVLAVLRSGDVTYRIEADVLRLRAGRAGLDLRAGS